MSVDQRLQSAVQSLREEVALSLEAAPNTRADQPKARRALARIAVAAVIVIGLGVTVAIVSSDTSSRSASVTADRSEATAGSQITLPPEIAGSYEEAVRTGRMPVVDETGRVRGYVPFDAGGLPNFGDYPKGVIPVTDGSGTVVGYIGPNVGFIEKSTVESPEFNLRTYAANRASH